MTTVQNKETFEGKLAKWAFPFLMSALIGFVSLQASQIQNNLEELKNEVTEMSKGEAILIEQIKYLDQRVINMDRWLDEVDKRLQEVERNQAAQIRRR